VPSSPWVGGPPPVILSYSRPRGDLSSVVGDQTRRCIGVAVGERSLLRFYQPVRGIRTISATSRSVMCQRERRIRLLMMACAPLGLSHSPATGSTPLTSSAAPVAPCCAVIGCHIPEKPEDSAGGGGVDTLALLLGRVGGRCTALRSVSARHLGSVRALTARRARPPRPPRPPPRPRRCPPLPRR
jgi:hypothetical protein